MEGSPIGEDTIIRRSGEAIEGALPEETVLLHVSRGDALRINATAAALWESLGQPARIGDLADELVERHGIERDRAVADVTAFAEDLIGRGFLEPVPA